MSIPNIIYQKGACFSVIEMCSESQNLCKHTFLWKNQIQIEHMLLWFSHIHLESAFAKCLSPKTKCPLTPNTNKYILKVDCPESLCCTEAAEV